MQWLITVILLFTITQNATAEALNAHELSFIKDLFNRIQPATFKNNREYCGYIGYADNGELIATAAHQGQENSCMRQAPAADFAVIASYHTHGAFSVEADAEFPSTDDMEADIAEDLDGFIATPGGRFWHIDTIEGIARMVCGRNCVLSDPNFDPEQVDAMQESYNLSELRVRDLEPL